MVGEETHPCARCKNVKSKPELARLRYTLGFFFVANDMADPGDMPDKRLYCGRCRRVTNLKYLSLAVLSIAAFVVVATLVGRYA